jgi:hypothetical protein
MLILEHKWQNSEQINVKRLDDSPEQQNQLN